MDQKYDFSGLDDISQPDKKYDFSGLDEQHETPGILKTLAYELGNPLGVTKHILAPAVDTMTGAIADTAGSDVDEQLRSQGFKGDIQAPQQSILDRYRQARANSIAQYEAMEKANPVAAFAGSLASGAALPLGAMAEGATTGQKILQGAKTGAAIGATGGAISSGGDLTTLLDKPSEFPQQLSQVALDTAKGGAAGGAIGGAISSVPALYSEAKDLATSAKNALVNKSESLANVENAFNLGTKGQTVTGKVAGEQIQKEISDISSKINDTLKENKTEFGKQIGDLVQKATDLGKSVNPEEDINDMLDSVNKELGSEKGISPTRDKLVNLLNSYKKTVEETRLVPSEKGTKLTPSTFEKRLVPKIEGMTERTPSTYESKLVPGEPNLTNPEDVARSQLLAKQQELNLKNKVLGTKSDINPIDIDQESGLMHFTDFSNPDSPQIYTKPISGDYPYTPLKSTKVEVPGSSYTPLELSKVKVPGSSYTPLELSKVEVPVESNLSPSDLVEARKATQKIAKSAPQGSYDSTVAGDIVNKFKELQTKTMGEDLGGQLNQANSRYALNKQAYQILNPKLESMNAVDNAQAQNAVSSLIEKLQVPNSNAKQTLDLFMDKFSQTNPELAQKIQPELEQLSTRFNLNREAYGKNLFGIGNMFNKFGIEGGNLAGKAYGAVEPTLENTGQVINKYAPSVPTMTKAATNAMSGQLSTPGHISAGQKVNMKPDRTEILNSYMKLKNSGNDHYADQLKDVVSADPFKQQQTVFKLNQDPKFRQAMRDGGKTDGNGE